MPRARYQVSQFDLVTFVVYDAIRKTEVCICGNAEDQTDAEMRANHIAALLNQNAVPKAPRLTRPQK